jgi:lysophospholipase L1-like esterase
MSFDSSSWLSRALSYLSDEHRHGYSLVARRKLGSRTIYLALVASGLTVVAVMHLQNYKCACAPLPACNTWSCDRPLATELHDDWPAWPPAAANAIPRDNLPSKSAEASWRALHASQVAEAKVATRTRVAFLGDSITEGWLRTGFSGRKSSVAQPQNEELWHKTFGEWAPLNLGIGGDRVQDLGWRLQHGLLAPALQPDVFVVLIGTNDLGCGEQWEVVAVELSLVLRQLHAARPSALVLVHSVFPRGQDELGGARGGGALRHRSPWWSESTNEYFAKIRQLNAEIAHLASSHASWVRLVDCSSEFLEQTVDPTDQLGPRSQLSTGSQVKVDGGGHDKPFERHIPVNLMYDLLHLTPDGYRRWARCLRPKLLAALKEGSTGSAADRKKASEAAPTTATQQEQRVRPRRQVLDGGPAAARLCVGRSCRGGGFDPGGIDIA